MTTENSSASAAGKEEWTLEITPIAGWWELHLEDLWRYRDLLMLFVRRDFVAVYKQTILGPIWFFIQPVLTTLTFTLVFGRIAGLSTDGVPQLLFYLTGITFWNYFSTCLTFTSNTFTSNAGIFGKVYFPRLIVPLSIVISNLLKFGIQYALFLLAWGWFLFTEDSVHPNWAMLLTPLLIVLMAFLGLGFGMIFSSLTTKYRDLAFLLQFGVQLLMYATPVIYPLSSIPEKYRWIILANPMTPVLETFKYGYLGAGVFEWSHLLYTCGFTAVLLLLALLVFNRVEQTFMDTV